MRTALIVLLLLASGTGDVFALSPEAYQNCTTLSKTAPEKSLAMAEGWLRDERSPEAKHCRAISLFALKRYDEAAKGLEEVFTQTQPEEVALSVSLLRQAARARALSGDTTTAEKRYTRAIEILQQMRHPNGLTTRLLAETLLERGELRSKAGDALSGLQDMDQAVSMEVLRERALISRARLLLTLGQTDMAEEDAEAALRIAPQSPEAQEVLKEIVSHSEEK